MLETFRMQHVWLPVWFEDCVCPRSRVDCQSSCLLVMSAAPKVYPLAQVPLAAHSFNAARTRAVPIVVSRIPLFLTSIANRCRSESELKRGYNIQLSRE
jgi:hypothetical protein